MSEPIEHVLVTVDDAALSRLAEVVARLRDAGMVIEKVMEPVGTITGSVPADTLDALRAVSGVEIVERQARSFGIPAPESDIQ
ncbi:MAG: hypothetical protein M3548_07255 [Actinomycetota bacterium]|nr:hypothetical protein [Actinomycetota bacterium]